MQRVSAEVASGTLVNELRSLPAFLHDGSPGTIDARTLDLVAMLFDAIFADRHIPSAMKAQLGRLQLAILKAVLLDAEFFSDRRQPARRLLDGLADLGLGFAGEAVASRAAVDLTRDVVHGILADFDPTGALRLDGRDGSRPSRRHEEADAPPGAARSSSSRRASVAMRRRVLRGGWSGGASSRARSSPPRVREMLAEDWVNALADVHLTRARHAGVASLVQTMEELLWSVEPSPRRRIGAGYLEPPAMIATWARAGARGHAPTRRVAFLATLVDCHALAVRRDAGMAAVPEFAARASASRKTRRARELVGGEIRVEDFRFRVGRGARDAKPSCSNGCVGPRQRGTWVEFSCLCGRRRARGSWV